MMFYLLCIMNHNILHRNFLKQCNLASKKYYLFVELPLNIYFLVRLILRGNIDHTKISTSIFHKSPLLKWSKSPQKWFNLTPGYGALTWHNVFSTFASQFVLNIFQVWLASWVASAGAHTPVRCSGQGFQNSGWRPDHVATPGEESLVQTTVWWQEAVPGPDARSVPVHDWAVHDALEIVSDRGDLVIF